MVWRCERGLRRANWLELEPPWFPHRSGYANVTKESKPRKIKRYHAEFKRPGVIGSDIVILYYIQTLA